MAGSVWRSGGGCLMAAAVAAVLMAAGMPASAQDGGSTAAREAPPPPPHLPPPPMPGWSLAGPQAERLLDQIQATEAQRAQLHKIQEAARSDLGPLHEKDRALHDQWLGLFTQPTVDAQAVEALRQKLVAQHDALTRRQAQAMLDASQVLTAAQRQQIATRLAERAGGPGRREHPQPPRGADAVR